MAKRIATQLAEEIASEIANAKEDNVYYVNFPVKHAVRWLKWAKALDARMRLDGSPRSKKRKSGA